MPCGTCEQPAMPLPAAPRLTIGIPVYDDLDCLKLTIQALRMHGGLERDEYEIIVVDNHPTGDWGPLTKSFCRSNGVLYVGMAQPVGTAAPREAIFQHGRGDVVLVIDSHVLIEYGAIPLMLDHVIESQDLFHGPMLLDDVEQVYACMRPEWGADLMYGIWEKDERADGYDPFEIPMMGLGLFACRRDAWLEQPKGLRGFGGCEGMLHERWRQVGRKVWCLPFLRWWHLFRETNRPFPVTLQDRLHNYLIWTKHIGGDLDEVVFRFRVKLPESEIAPIVASLEMQLPPVYKQVWNYAKAMAKYVAAGRPNVTEVQYQERLTICDTCELLREDKCIACGCPAEAKASMATEQCPHPSGPRWPALQAPDSPTACEHPKWEARVNVENARPHVKAEITIRCEKCGQFYVPHAYDGTRFHMRPQA